MVLIRTISIVVFMLFTSIALAKSGNKDAAEIRAGWMEVADAIHRSGQESSAADLKAALDAMTDEELYLGYGDIDLEGLANAFSDTATAFEALRDMYESKGYAKTRSAFDARKSAGDTFAQSAGLPDALGYPGAFCPYSPDRSNADDVVIAVDAIAAAGIALEVAEGVWALTDRACGLVVVAIGAVGNPQTAICIAADIILFAAKALLNAARAVVDHINFCDSAVDASEIEGTYERAGHIHDDLESHDTNIDTDLAAHDANIDADLAAHDANIDADLAAHDANIDADLSQHDADIKLLLSNLQGAVNENQRLIKITMARQQEILRLLLTPDGRRVINEDVLTCTGLGDDCPVVPVLQICPNGSLKWNCN